MTDYEKILLMQDTDPVRCVKSLVQLLDDVQKQQKLTMEVLHARSEMTKIAIAALQRTAIDPTHPKVGQNAACALERMKEIWLTAEKLTGGTLDEQQNNNHQVKF